MVVGWEFRGQRRNVGHSNGCANLKHITVGTPYFKAQLGSSMLHGITVAGKIFFFNGER